MGRLEGPGSEQRLRALHARFRDVSRQFGGRGIFDAAGPTSKDLRLFLILAAAFVIVGLAAWRMLGS